MQQNAAAIVEVAVPAVSKLLAVWFLSPEFFLLHFGTLDSPFAHLLVMFNLSLGKLAVFFEYDVEAKQEYAQAYYNYGD